MGNSSSSKQTESKKRPEPTTRTDTAKVVSNRPSTTNEAKTSASSEIKAVTPPEQKATDSGDRDVWPEDPSRRPRCSHPSVRNAGNDVFICNECGNPLDDPNRILLELEMKRVASSKERAEPVDALSLGVRISWLLEFTKTNDLWNVPTWRVCRDFILPPTKDSRCRYAELPAMKTSGVTGKASTYVCHCWGAPFGLLVQALSENDAHLERYVWIDLFAVRQWPSDNPDLNFQSVIRRCTAFVVVSPYVKEMIDVNAKDRQNRNISAVPKRALSTIPFFRTWCLFEMYVAATKPDMMILFKCGVDNVEPEQFQEFLQAVHAMVDISCSATSIENDHTRLLDTAMKEDGGLETVNDVICRILNVYLHQDDGSECLSTLSLAFIGDPIPKAKLFSERNDSTRKQFFRFAVQNGFAALVDEMLKDGYISKSEINMKFKDGMTACMLACQGGHEFCLEVLLEHGGDIHIRNKTGKSACLYAAEGGFEDCLQVLLDSNCDFNTADNEGYTPCMLAAESGNVHCLDMLLKKGCDFEAKTKFGYTACMLAAARGHELNLKVLLDLNCNVEVKAADSYTAFLLAAVGCHFGCMKLLVERFCNPRISSNDGMNALLWAATGGSEDCMRLAIARGIDIESTDLNGVNSVMYAAQGGHLHCLKLLLKTKCGAFSKTVFGYTAVMYSAAGGHYDCLKLLIDKKCDINAVANDGCTACIYATQGGFEDCLKLLIAHGCNINTVAHDGYSAYLHAAALGHYNCLKMLIDNGCDVWLRDPRGKNAFSLAYEGGHNSCQELVYSVTRQKE